MTLITLYLGFTYLSRYKYTAIFLFSNKRYIKNSKLCF
nr:MAG TPA: hypothetical protein [Caudoviricetes sp.]